MTIGSVLQELENGTDGLASAYQQTQVTGTGHATVEDTAGVFFLSVMTFPVLRLLGPCATEAKGPTSQLEGPVLAREMAGNTDFRRLVEQGLAELAEGRHSKLEDVKRRVGDI